MDQIIESSIEEALANFDADEGVQVARFRTPNEVAIDYDNSMMEAEMHELEQFLKDNLHRETENEEGYILMPSYLYIGKESNPNLFFESNLVYIFFDDNVLLEGITIECLFSNEQEIDRLLVKIHSFAPFSIDIVMRIESRFRYHVINPGCSSEDH